MFLSEINQPITIGLDEAVKLLGFKSPTHLRIKAKKGLIPGFKAGRSWMFYMPDLIEYIQKKSRQNYKPEDKLWHLARSQAATTTIRASRSVVSECKNLREQLREQKRKSMKRSADER